MNSVPQPFIKVRISASNAVAFIVTTTAEVLGVLPGDLNAVEFRTVGRQVVKLLAGGGPDRTPMVNGAYDQYRVALAPFARGDYVDPASDPALRSYLDVLKNDVSTQVNGMFAGAGRDISGMNQQALARGITQAEAPVLLDAYNRALAGQRSAIDSIYGSGGQTAAL